MKTTVTSPVKRPSRLVPSDEVIRRVQREQSDILRRLLRVQFETLREPRTPMSSEQPPITRSQVRAWRFARDDMRRRRPSTEHCFVFSPN